MHDIKIANKTIGTGQKPFVVAEMSGNHNNSLENALAIVDAAAASGADAIKLQTYTADTMTIDLDEDDFFISDPESLWKGTSLYKLYEQAHTPWDWHKPIMDRAREHGLICFSSPFDATAVDFLESLDVPAYKIASFESIDLPLVRKVAALKKPLIISTGMATVAEIDECVREARAVGCEDLILLKCTSSYPAEPVNTNIKTIPHMRDMFQAHVGLSDHTMGSGVAIASVALGAVFIEKHFINSRSQGGVDSAFSAEPAEFKALVEDCTRAQQALGAVCYGAGEAEKKSMRFRRSIYVVEDVEAGAEFNDKNVRTIRPGFGLAPKYYDVVLGKRAKNKVAKGTAFCWDLIE